MWIYKGKPLNEIPEGAVGFVYLITRTNLIQDSSSPILYVGKKSFYLKAKTESDWSEYYSSSDWIKDDIKKYGKHAFHREILRICYSKSEMTYYEVKEQFDRNVLGSRYYNLNISGKYFHDTIFCKEDVARVSPQHQVPIRVPITNGEESKYLYCYLEDIKEFFSQNHWFLGYTHSSTNKSNKNVYYITNIHTELSNGEQDIVIKNDEVAEFLSKNDDYWIVSRGINKKESCFQYKEKVHVNKDGEVKFVYVDEIEDGWEIGQLKRDVAQRTVKAKNMFTNEKVLVSKEEFKNSKELVPLKEKKVQIKLGSKIVFKGYLKQFLQENEGLVESRFKTALKSLDGAVKGTEYFIK